MHWRWRPGIVLEESGGFLQVSGLTYTIDASVKSGVRTDDKGNFTGVSGAYRVMDIKVGGEPIDLSRTYTVASHNYMLKQGGDGMTMFRGCNVIRDEVMVDVDILSSYIRRMGGFVTSEYGNPGRTGEDYHKVKTGENRTGNDGNFSIDIYI